MNNNQPEPNSSAPRRTGQMNQELQDDEEVAIIPPNSYFRQAMPHGLSIQDSHGNSITHYPAFDDHQLL